VLATDFGMPAPTLAMSAEQALRQHTWPGEDLELDGVLARTLLALPTGVAIEASHLIWSAGDPAPEAVPQPPLDDLHESATRPVAQDPGPKAPDDDPARDPISSPAPTADSSQDQSTVESIAIELAHHLKNPLVTLKTFVSNAGRLGEDPEKLERFSTLANDSIGRMDATLDELLDYARLPEENTRSVDILGCLRAALRDVWDGLDAKKVSLQGPEPQELRAQFRPIHLTFAFRTLARYLEEAVEPRGILRLEAPSDRTIDISFPEAESQRHLREALLNGAGSFPLSLLLVRGALIQGGGTFSVERNGSDLKLILGFPTS